MTKRKRSYSNVPDDVVYVSVYCSGRAGPGGLPAHQDRPWRLATYYYDADMPSSTDAVQQWQEAAGQYWTAAGEVVVMGTAATRTGMVGDRPVTQDEYRADRSVFDQGNSRSRYKLACRHPDCGLSVVARAETLMPRIARIHEAGIKEVSLVALAAMLTIA